jgi:type IV pilus assembly protein PilB
VDLDLIALVGARFIQRHRIAPVAHEGGAVLVATPELENRQGLLELRHLLRDQPLRLLRVSPEAFEAFVRRRVERSRPAGVDLVREAAQRAARQVSYPGPAGLRAEGEPNSAAVELVSMLLAEAVEREASDLLIDPSRDGVVVRFRCEGRWVARPELISPALHATVVSRIKVLSGMDITERRLPQDGRFAVRIQSAAYDLRVATVATLHGEKVALRILDSSKLQRDLGGLLLWPRALEAARRLFNQPSGLVMVTGPSGSGKTTTLYAALMERNRPEISIVTVEDPIEYDVGGVSQVPVQPAAGVGFPEVLRSFLRQAPDVILVGEMRDRQTADLTGNAALTGHLVLTSFHTHDALSTVPRLIDMGVEPYIVAAALTGILNQRLVRRNCLHCREPVHYSRVVMESLRRAGVSLPEDARLFRVPGCPRCGFDGFHGRVGLYEVLEATQGLRDAIGAGAPGAELRRLAQAGTFVSMADYAAWLLLNGLTVPNEVLRVLPAVED